MKKLLLLLSFALPALAQHAYWRVYIDGANAQPEVLMTELQFYDAAGNYLPTGGTPIVCGSDTGFGGTTGSGLFDASLSTWWKSSSGGTAVSPTTPAWAGYHFASAVSVSVVRVVWSPDAGLGFFQMANSGPPTSLRVQYSDNGTLWFDATGTMVPGTWRVNGETVAWSAAVGAPPAGYFSNWRIRVNSLNSGTGMIVSEVKFHDVAGGPSLTSTASSDAVYAISAEGFAGSIPPPAFDGSASTVFNSDGSSPDWIGWTFGQLHAVVSFDWTNSPSTANNSPASVTVQGSNDMGADWTDVFSCSLTWTAPGQTRTCGATPTAQGNIVYSQIRRLDRQGTAHVFQMFGGGGVVVPGHGVKFNANGETVDAGGNAMIWVSAPNSHTDPCTPGMFSMDGSGYFYYCISANLWARVLGDFASW